MFVRAPDIEIRPSAVQVYLSNQSWIKAFSHNANSDSAGVMRLSVFKNIYVTCIKEPRGECH